MVNAWSIEESNGAMGKVFLAFVIMGWIVWRHRSNIIRLREGTENRFQKKSKN
jgi:glycerol-3-phosphate acyltransferase PlsY